MKAMSWCVIVGIIFCSVASNAATFLYFNSEPGDYIGEGIEQTWSPEDGVFTVTGDVSSNVVSIDFDGTSWWYLNFAAPSGQTLHPGPYEDATRYPFQSPTLPGLSVYGNGSGCNTLTGRFDILEISYTSGGEIDRFAADFEQHCDGEDPALFGSIRYNATVGYPLKVDIKANGRDTPIIVNVGEAVEISVTTDAGDDEGISAEYWLGRSGTYGTQWFNGRKWDNAHVWPHMWIQRPVTTHDYKFSWIPKSPGIYIFQFVVDYQLDKKLNTQFMDHIVITVLQN
jgi:hypothetical protein